MTLVEIRAAQRIRVALLKQSKEKMRDQDQNLSKGEAWPFYMKRLTKLYVSTSLDFPMPMKLLTLACL